MKSNKYLYTIFLYLVSSPFFYYTYLDLYAKIVLLVLLNIYALATIKFDLLHPMFWLLSSIMVYNIPYLLFGKLYIMNNYQPHMVLLGTFIASFAVVSFGRIRFKINHKSKRLKLSPAILKTLLIFTGVVSIIISIILIKQNFSNKGDIKLYSGVTTYYAFIKIFSNLIIVKMYYKFKFREKSFDKAYIIWFSILLFISINIGERDVILTFLVSSFLFAYYYKIIKKKTLIAIGVMIIVLIPTLSVFQLAISRATVSIELNSLMYYMFHGEFSSAGRNFDKLLENSDSWSFFYGRFYLFDIIRGVIPINLLSIENSSRWFNETFNAHLARKGMGAGFSYIASGYINFGFFGVFLSYAFITSILKKLYAKSKSSEKFLFYYILIIPLVVFSQRGDFSTILSPFFKQIFLPLFFIELWNRSNTASG